MERITRFLVRYPIWGSVMLFSILVFGAIALSQMRYSFFPETEPDTITVQVSFPGASPDEVAEGVAIKIEDQLDGLAGVERVTSVSRENSANVTVEITKDADVEKVLTDVKNAVDEINSFPVGVEKPVIFEQKFRSRSLSVVMYGETDLYNLKYLAEEFRDELLTLPEVSQVDIEGLPALEFSIEVSESDMRRYGLTFDEIARAVALSNVNISGGKLETPDEEILIRTWGRGYQAEDLLGIPVRGNADGSVIYLADIAQVKEQWEDTPEKRYYNGQTAVRINFDQTADEDILLIGDLVTEHVARFNETHESIHAEVIDDRTIPLRQRIELLSKNGLIGLFLVITALGFFLNLRLSWWVSVSIPFSFAGMFVIASFAGITINVISLFGMIIVVGILVDDGIVVGENIFAHYERGKSAVQAAVDGTREVMAPVITSVVTTMIVFLAFFFIEGMMGKFIWQMALVVIASLLFSLIEGFFILPSHLAHSKGLSPHKADPPIRKKIEAAIKFLTERMYIPVLKGSLKNKWITVITPAALVLVTIGLLGGGFIGWTFFPEIDSDRISISATLVSGRQEADTDQVLRRIESAAWEVNEDIRGEREDGRDVVIGVQRDVGVSDFGVSGSHAGRVVVMLLDGEHRQMESYLIANRIRDKVGPVAEAENITYGGGGRFGKAVSISLLGHDFEQLDKARNLLVDELKQFGSLKDVTDSDVKGRREVSITLKPRAHALGLTLNDVVGQVRQGFYGQEIQRIQRGRDEIRVWVRYRPEDRATMGLLEQMYIRTPGEEEYPFGELAEYTVERGIVSINHLDRQREIKVEANQSDVEEDLPPILEEIQADVLPRVLGQVNGVKASFEGQSREQQKMSRSMMIAFPVALAGMFILIILVFRSYAQAVIIFSLIPIGILGAVWGHGFHGMQLNMLSVIGVIAMSGVIINDSIVLIDQVNRYLRQGQKVYDAVVNAGVARLRPILLTSLTTSLGLAPLILETSRQAQFLIPMAISVAYGLIFGTIILLLILPASILVLNSIRLRWAWLLGRRDLTSEAVEPAVREGKVAVVKP